MSYNILGKRYAQWTVKLASFCVCFVLASCANMSQLEKDSFDEISQLKQEFEGNQNNALYHLKLAHEYEKLAKERQSVAYLRKAIEEYANALTLEPENNQIMLSLYQLNYTGVLGGFINEQQLIQLYQRLDPMFRQRLNPPHLAIFQRDSVRLPYNDKNEQRLKGNLLKAFEERPFNPVVSYLLSSFYVEEENYVLAIDIVKRALALEPDDALLVMQLGIAYEAYANRDYCAFNHPDELQKSLNHLQQAAREYPDNPILHDTLSILYERLNVPFMMVDSAKKMVASDGSPYSKLLLAEALSNAGQLSKAEPILEALIKERVDRALVDRATLYAENGQWEASYASSTSYMQKSNEMPIYPALLHLVLEEVLRKPPTSLETMSRYVDANKLSLWERALYEFWFGVISEQQLLELSTDVCRQAESNFLIGVKHFHDDSSQLARETLTKVVDTNTFSFVEYRITPHLLAMLDAQPQPEQ